jgi:hypothetical protein
MKNIVYILLTFLLVLSACNDDELLNQSPHNLTDKALYATVDGATQGLFAAYDILQYGERVERVELLGTVCSGDALPGGEPGGNDQPSMQRAARFAPQNSDQYYDDYWSNLYTGIYRCNLLLSYLEKPEELIDFPEETRNRLMGDALFLRGLFHFKLQIFFGGYPQLQDDFNGQLKGVPFIDHIMPPEEWTQERPAIEETWTKIENDFSAAADLLPLRSQMDDVELGRATKGAAMAMLAKTYLYQNKFDEAYSVASQVIASGEYKLMGEAGTGPFIVQRWTKYGDVPVEMSGYQFIWQKEANNCLESIFDVQHWGDNNAASSDGTTEGNILPQYYGVRRVWTFATGLYLSTEYYWGFILPTPYFINTAYADIGCVENDTIKDPRFQISVIEPTDSLPYQYEVPVRPLYSDSVLFDPWGNWPSTGYATWKYFLHPEDQQRASWYENPQNTKYFRFADLLLIGAEAAVQSGHTADALTWINRVRERARLSGNTGFPKPLTDVTVEDVYAERRVELAFESHQFYDVVRTGRAQQIIQEEAMQYPTVTNDSTGAVANVEFGDAFMVGRNEIFPIPQSEIDATQGLISQNPNY